MPAATLRSIDSGSNENSLCAGRRKYDPGGRSVNTTLPFSEVAALRRYPRLAASLPLSDSSASLTDTR